jgi:hypothetical protein
MMRVLGPVSHTFCHRSAAASVPNSLHETPLGICRGDEAPCLAQGHPGKSSSNLRPPRSLLRIKDRTAWIWCIHDGTVVAEDTMHASVVSCERNSASNPGVLTEAFLGMCRPVMSCWYVGGFLWVSAPCRKPIATFSHDPNSMGPVLCDLFRSRTEPFW